MGIQPTELSISVRPGDEFEDPKTVAITIPPSKVDVVFAIDTTGSMQPGIDTLKSRINSIASNIQSLVADSKFGVIQFKDYCSQVFPCTGPGCTFPGGSPYPNDSPEYRVDVALTTNVSTVQSMVNSYVADGGGDAAEAHNLLFQKAYTDSTIGWRSDARKFLIVLSDAEPHGAGTSGVPDCLDTTSDPHSLDTLTELHNLRDNFISVIMVLQDIPVTTSATIDAYEGIAGESYDGSTAFVSNTSLVTNVTAAVNGGLGAPEGHLELVSAGPSPADASWITLPAPIGPFASTGTYSMGSIVISIPGDAPGGTYTFEFKAIVGGVDYGHQILTITIGAGIDVNDVEFRAFR